MQLQDHLESDINEKLLWLKNCCDPWETVEDYWTITAKTRLTRLQSNEYTIQQYFSEFKPLNQPGGIFLLLKDYAHLYPGNNQTLSGNWLLMRPKLIKLAKNRSDAFLKDMLADIDHEQREEVMDLAALMAIPFLMTTSNVGKSKNKTKPKRLWRPSKQEVLEGFIIHVKCAAHIEDTIARRAEKLREMELTLQPSIVIVGPSIKEISGRYIIVNNVRYEVTSIINAVDACFKIIFVLNAQYPAESNNVWQFIQTALYQIKTKYDKIYTTVNTLMTDLNIQQGE
ncbi:uncharacterized protein LOC125233141 isoform X2 [Leguminivora glycinivorella]|uniref:uncharacterized protein LOC125226819 isoform X2 n=2 Tax=Leguminivora glycinivorella TaxID=1035111 RepID=UPI00200C478F|nr:uncharacterized protein LOC125226819 isoform X2 [Leguminivora glycinivorella]XP_047994976.1 uncharacterized protein LOC125233141 isoform X2 [Leguminivora glycinivorella]